MDDLISRKWLLEQLQGLGNTTLLKRNFLALVNNAPRVDAEEVVRCKDCKQENKCLRTRKNPEDCALWLPKED